MRITVFGAGYVGLVTAACLSAKGHDVTCVDVDAVKVALIQSGESPIFESGLKELIREGLAQNRFRTTVDAAEALAGAEASLIAVGTPDQEGRIDLRYVREVAGVLGEHIRRTGSKHLVVVKSTVVPGTTEGPVREMLESRSGKRAGEGFGLGMNPEFLREGFAVGDFLEADRIVLGALDEWTAATMRQIYDSFACPKLVTSPTEAEMIKYTANALLSTLISFSNEIFGICETLPGADGHRVLEAVLADRRWTPLADGRPVIPGIQSYVMGGIGYGGSCFPKDMNAITAQARDLGWNAPLLHATVAVNRARPGAVVARLEREVGALDGKKIAVLGLAFKPGTDDWRNSPSQPLVQALLDRGARVCAWDPLVGEEAVAAWNGRVALLHNPEEAVSDAHAALLATAWPEIARWPWAALVKSMAYPLIYDGRNLLRTISWPKGVRYVPAGTGPRPQGAES